MKEENRLNILKTRNILQELGMVFVTTVFFTVIILKVYKINLRLPLNYDGDALFSGYVIKTIHEYGWWFQNSTIGMPFGATLYDFSSFNFESFNFLIIKILVFFLKDWGKVINIFYLSLFPITAIMSHYVMRKLKINFYISFLGSIYYTFLNYRFTRGINHLFLSAYYLIPLVVLLCYILYTDEMVFKIDKNFFKNKRNIFFLFLLIILSLSGIYYVFFSCFFIFVTLISKIERKNIKFFFEKILVCYLTIAFTMILVYIPEIIYKLKVGTNLEGPKRSPFEAEYYGLRITELIIPKNLFVLFKEISKNIQESILDYRIIPTERTEYLGIIGILGLLYLLWLLVKDTKKNELNTLLKILNISGILFGVTSGFGSLFAIFISPQIRGYGRISVFIAYFCILAVCSKLNEYDLKKSKKKIFYIILTVAFWFSIWEQIPLGINYKISNEKYLAEYVNNEKFINYIESKMGNQGKIFQLPYVKFPETPPLNKLTDYELLKGYLHSDKLKWSYGGYKGRKTDLWNREISSYPIEEMLEKISIAGFNGVYLDRRAYLEKEHQELENNITKVTGVLPHISDNGKLVFFDLRNYNKSIVEKYPKEYYENQKDKILNTMILTKGFYQKEQKNDKKWRWTEKIFEIDVINDSSNFSTYNLKSQVFSEYVENSELVIEYNDKVEKYKINNNGIKLDLLVKLKKGSNIIKFRTNAKRVHAPLDGREMYLRFENIEENIEKN